MNILLADQHSHTRLGLEMLLNREPGVSIAGSVADGASLLALAQTTHPDFVILADTLPGPPVEDLIPRLRTVHPGLKIILLCSAGFDCKDTFDCVQKSDPPGVLLTLFRAMRQIKNPVNAGNT